ncbi:efflux RND transporter periplasmic adaptor subunit [Kordiimonas aestuarii]|uniref:hypothetical protein n=1 Tax=Kordiimonas aestuarii TaxID=1005925 RepID=UPI0021CF90ED|nr:hypothetical protein [Kordiimonas aestuarii]
MQKRLGIVTMPLEERQVSHSSPMFATVLDPSPLVTLFSDRRIARLTLVNARTEAARTKSLNKNGNAISTKDMEAAGLTAAVARERLLSLNQRIMLEWGPAVGKMDEAEQTRIVAALVDGKAALLRVDASAGHGLTETEFVRLRLADGETLEARVLGPARSADTYLQSAGIIALVEQDRVLPLSAGLMLNAATKAEQQRGVFVPETALLYMGGQISVYVATGQESFVQHILTNYQPAADGLLVKAGLKAGDLVVTSGAAILYSTATPQEGED